MNQDAVDFGHSVADSLEGLWGKATAAPTGDLDRLWKSAAEQGWLELGGEGALEFLAAATFELGKVACPFPLVDAYVAAQLLTGDRRKAQEAGELRVVVALGDTFSELEGATDVTHVLHLTAEAATLHALQDSRETPGLAVPAWSNAEVGPGELLGPVEDAVSTYRFGLAVRALGAAARAHDLAVEHSTTRRQFGRAIGSFGAVQQRVAACEIDVRAAEALVADSSRNGRLSQDLATQFVRDVVTGVMFGAQHTLGAIGFFEEHEAAWLFRRVHSDVARLDSTVPVAADVTAALIEGGQSLPAFDLGETAEAFRSEVRGLLAQHDGDVEGLRFAMSERGWFALGWPRSEGGLEASVEEQVVLNEEMKYARGPVDRAMSATMLLGHSIVRHGTPGQKAEFLPLIREGRLAFCLGYSEPEAGSDLASLRTRAVRDGESWVINGQKSWTTRANTASHVWLAVRTDPDAKPRHAGITILLVPTDTPGIEVQQHVALSGEISCTVFYDDVRVPDTARVGEVNGGWKVITDALTAERVVMGGVASTLLRGLDDLLEELRESPFRLGGDDSYLRRRLASVAARLQAARALVLEATRSMRDDAGDRRPRLAGPMAAVLSGELAEDFGQAALELLGPSAALGRFDHALRVAPMYVIGGGTNDIQRGIIARGLGLPRE
jgi:alkylation response protein AidB-like acyl-CoA dehydrogenase